MNPKSINQTLFTIYRLVPVKVKTQQGKFTWGDVPAVNIKMDGSGKLVAVENRRGIAYSHRHFQKFRRPTKFKGHKE